MSTAATASRWPAGTRTTITISWLGYDYIVNLEVIDDTTTTINRWNDGRWQSVGRATFQVNGNGIELALSRNLVSETSGDPAFDFHWADNIQSFDGIAELGCNGDNAPNRRWNYHFEVAK